MSKIDWNAVITAEDKAAEAQVARRAGAVAEGARRLAALAAAYLPEERETWPTQVAEANALLAEPNAPAPFLRSRAAGRGVEATVLAALVIELADQYAAASGAILAAQDVLVAGDTIPEDFADDRHWCRAKEKVAVNGV